MFALPRFPAAPGKYDLQNESQLRHLLEETFRKLLGFFGPPLYLEASRPTYASLNMPHGSAPTTPRDGDMWTTTAGLYVRINGATVGPLT